MVMKLIIFFTVTQADGTQLAVKNAFYNAVFVPMFANPLNASLAFAIAYNLVFWTIAYILYKRNIFIKI